MLKNKKVIYLLLPVNLLIWGFFIYRIYSAFNETEIPGTILRKQNLELETVKDSSNYNLSLNYKDPFLKDAERIANVGEGNNPSAPMIKKEPPVSKTPLIIPKQLPDVKYLGLIKNNSSGLSTALISVNGQSRLIKQNETIDGIVFKSFNRDSLVAKWGRERIVARK